MAQLIKMEDYISRYEIDLNRYANQFIRLKKQQWEEIKKRFESIQFAHSTLDSEKQLFLDRIFNSQLVWASSTIREISPMDEAFEKDSLLKYFLQRFPDTYFVMYYPVFLIKKASVQGEIIIIRPTDIVCLTALEYKENNVLIGTKQKFWLKRDDQGEKKILSPIIGLERTANIVKQILSNVEVDFPIRKILLNRTGYIHASELPADIEIIDVRSYDDWFQNMRRQPSPFKNMQLKAVKALLASCATNAVKRFNE